MKTAAKVFIIIGMVFGAIAIFPLVVGAIALGKLGTAQNKNELTTIAILTLIFCSPIAGILMLCMSDDDLSGANKGTAYSTQPTTTYVYNSPSAAEVSQTKKLTFQQRKQKIEIFNTLLEKGTISKEEYDERMREIGADPSTENAEKHGEDSPKVKESDPKTPNYDVKGISERETIELLKEYKNLLDSGIISQGEFIMYPIRWTQQEKGIA